MQIPETSTTLLRQLAADSQHARWTEFVGRYQPMMMEYLRLHFPKLEAEDIVSETFLAKDKGLSLPSSCERAVGEVQCPLPVVGRKAVAFGAAHVAEGRWHRVEAESLARKELPRGRQCG